MSTHLPPGSWPWLHELARWIARWLFRPAYRIRVHGLGRVPRTGPVVLVANHSTLVEPQLLFGLLPRRSVFLVKHELFAGPLAWALPRIGQLAVHRGTPERAPLLTAVRVLRGGGLISVFPEGTRGDGHVERAEQGAAWLVRSSDAVLLPVAVRGTLAQPGPRRFRPVVDVLVGEPFPLAVERGGRGLRDATEVIRMRLSELVARLDRDRSDSVRRVSG